MMLIRLYRKLDPHCGQALWCGRGSDDVRREKHPVSFLRAFTTRFIGIRFILKRSIHTLDHTRATPPPHRRSRPLSRAHLPFLSVSLPWLRRGRRVPTRCGAALRRGRARWHRTPDSAACGVRAMWPARAAVLAPLARGVLGPPHQRPGASGAGAWGPAVGGASPVSPRRRCANGRVAGTPTAVPRPPAGTFPASTGGR
jgi:hypothetical protein